MLRLPNIVFGSHIGGIDTKGMGELADRCIVQAFSGRLASGVRLNDVNDGLKDDWRW